MYIVDSCVRLDITVNYLNDACSPQGQRWHGKVPEYDRPQRDVIQPPERQRRTLPSRTLVQSLKSTSSLAKRRSGSEATVESIHKTRPAVEGGHYVTVYRKSVVVGSQSSVVSRQQRLAAA